MYQPYAEPEIRKWVRPARLRWAGHIVRREKSTSDLLLRERTAGRPKRRWTEEVERTEWKRVALERDKWKKIVEHAKA
jgi:hypothetical protein